MNPMPYLVNWSVRRTLIAMLLLLTISVWGVSSLILYVEAGQESQELFDQSLQETAHLLLTLADHEVQEQRTLGPHVPVQGAQGVSERYLLFQMWDQNGRLLYKNSGAPDRPFSGPDHAGFGSVTLEGNKWRIYTVWNRSHQLQIQVAEPGTHRKEISGRFAWKLLAFVMLVIPVMTMGIWWSVNRVLRPLLVSADEVGQRTPNDLHDVRIAGAPTELRPLLVAINHLFERVRNALEREQRFTADAAHELRTPLAAIKTNLQVLQRARSEQERDEFITGLGVSVDRATRLVEQLMTLARLDPQHGRHAQLTAQDISMLLAQQLPELANQAGKLQLQFTTQCQSAVCLVHADSFLIMFRNLADNALRYTPAPGTVTVSCGVELEQAWLRIANTGAGIPAPMRERIFERFFRLSAAGQSGSGLGLSIVRSIVQAHGATIDLEDGMDGAGLLITIRFPAWIITSDSAQIVK